ncbi:DNA replication/repair protein RecF [Ponticaulis sp.]|uniref:DNA replication/repair protein RecF n=1 Tax=Ponticaulis sp. TaxID=2020902 RepID=UPI000B689FF6|nr:DNA replication/repair protein RecF [Ponticaulis sp.]MAI89261.1 DNA replication/repair protein RecF [Ponticaulis sp.]OUY01251.1 MAG: DNA replication/repair protein RecF [Hyphomonadaceae bacterium TMED5]|tara:strand:+ start:5289 stop:6440 length:1152 start_codon:yes stop_codon:yes gene_type:complete
MDGAGRIYLKRLALSTFRNYSALSMALDGRHVCLYGANGAGKTNLIEAISQLSPGRGLRSAGLPDMAKVEAGQAGSNWAMGATLFDGDMDRSIRIDASMEGSGRGKRSMQIDGAGSTAGALSELVRIIWLTPAMDRVFAGGATERRKFLDRQTLAHFPNHARHSTAYEKAMRERNLLLERDFPDPVWLDGLEARLAEHGAQIAFNRVQTVSRLQAAVETRPDGAFPKADLGLEGLAEEAFSEGKSVSEVEALLKDALSEGRRRDARAGRTLSGPHRSDLVVIHRPTGVPAALCSTGQQKALLIGLILSNARALEAEEHLRNPLVLLDEAVAHLDPDRRAALFDELSALNGQAWLTGTERSLFEGFGDRAQYFEVSGGEVIAQD